MPTTTPNMGLQAPVVGVEPGPNWAIEVNGDLYAIDSHNHSNGQGVQINPNGIDINADLPMNGNNLTTARSVRFSSQGAPLSGGSDIGCIYESGVDLWYNDGAGNQVQMTQGGSIKGPFGTITGLPSGTASASFAGGTFSFFQMTNVPASMYVGPVIFGAAIANPKTVTVSAQAAQAANYNINWPLVPGLSGQALVSDGSGNLTWQSLAFGQLPLGSVIATFPNLTGAYTTTATTVADASGFVLCQGQTISDVTSPMNGAVIPAITGTTFLAGSTVAGTTGGASSVILSIGQLPSHTHTFSAAQTVATATHEHNISHVHGWSFQTNGSPPNILSSQTIDPTQTGSGAVQYMVQDPVQGGTGSLALQLVNPSSASNWYTSGVLDPPGGSSGASAQSGVPTATTGISGTTDATGSGSPVSTVPPYISAVYLMRIK